LRNAFAFARFWPQQKPGFSQKPGFLGVRVDWMSVLADSRNPVGKKLGFLIDWMSVLADSRNPVGKKPGFLIDSMSTPETRLAKNRVS
jgi:hypothetical protein